MKNFLLFVKMTSGNVLIYRRGVWAKRVEYVKVETLGDPNLEFNDDGIDYIFRFSTLKGGGDISMKILHEYLTKQLEDYINNKK